MSEPLTVHHHLHGAKLGPKLGPFPVVVWALIIAAGLYVAHRRSQSAAASASSSTTDTTASTDATGSIPDGASTDTPDGTGDFGGGGGGGTGGPISPISSSGGSSSDPTAGTGSNSGTGDYIDNVTWTNTAISALIKAGVTPILANNAIQHFLAGHVLTTEEAHAVNVALTLVGPPPEGAPPVRVQADQPATTPPPPRPDAPHKTPRPATHKAPTPSKRAPRPAHPRDHHGRRYTVRAGDTLYAIAAAHHVGEGALYSKNRHTIEATAKHHGKRSSESGHWIYPGTVLVLP